MLPSKAMSLRLPLLLLVLGFFFACHLSTSSETEQSFTFPALADSVAGADQVTILLKDTAGHTLDVLFDGPVTAATAFQSLKAPHYQGGTVLVTIEAKKDGQVIYAVKQTYDGDRGKVTHSTTVVARAPSVRLAWPTPRLREGDSLAFPPVTVLPRSLENPSVRFISRDPSRLRVGEARLHALLQGQARLVVMLEADTLVRDSLEVEILSKDDPGLSRLTLSPKPLPLALRGPKGRFTVASEPPEAKVELLWSALDSAIVSVSPDGELTPHSEGQGRIVVASAQDLLKTDTAWVHVLPPQPVDSVRFEMDSLEVFVGGAPDSLRAQVHPPLAPPGVTFSLADRTLARIEGGTLEALIEGETWLHVRSVEDPAKRDSLRLLVFPKEPVDSVRVKPDTLRLFVKGPQGALTASIHPTTLQGRFRWSVTDPAIASVDGSGQMSPGTAGKTYVTAAARADASKRDSALLIVVQDTPRLTVGMDTVIPVGATVTHRPQVTQEYGEVVLFRWDLDGNGNYEDSSTSVPATLTHTYAQTQVYTARFHVRDSEGNDTTVFRKVSAVEGRVVQIVSPKDSSYTNQGQIMVSWLVDGEPFSNAETLKPGANTLTRSAKDATGHTFSHSITVFLDQAAPSRPVVSGPAVPVNTLTPTWTWVSGGGGNGLFRLRLDDPDLIASVASPDTFFTAPQNLPGGAHTLYVQERDDAGNWSLSGSFAIRIDTTAPAAPSLSVSPSGATNNARPTWSWTGGTGDAYRYYRFKLGDDDFRSGGKDTVGPSYQPPALPEGTHTLFVQVRDSAGNWSPSASASVTVDLSAPTPPRLDSTPYSPLNSLRPRWTWRSGTGGARVFRARVDNASLEGAAEQTDSSFTPAENLTEGSHTLYVQERDEAGNWSAAAKRELIVAVDRILGEDQLPKGQINQYSLLMSPSDEPFISFNSGANIYIAKFSDNQWQLAPSLGFGSSHPPALTFSGSGDPHLAYTDVNGDSLLVIAYSSGTWTPIGSARSTPMWLGDVSIDMDDSDNLFLAYTDADSNKVVVEKFENGDWVALGTNPFVRGANYYSMFMRVSNQGQPYVISLKNGVAAANKWNGIEWVSLGWDGFAEGGPFVIGFNLDRAGTPFVSYSDYRHENKVSVKSFQGSDWYYHGAPGFSTKTSSQPILVIGPRDSPYVVTDEGSVAEREISAYTQREGKWVKVGPSIEGTSGRLSAATDRHGVLYIAVESGRDGNITVYKKAFEQ